MIRGSEVYQDTGSNLIESLRGSTSASLKIGEVLAIRKNLASQFETGGHSYFALLVDRFIT